METKPRYWFPAKTYGWGWGPPATWQGWVVLGIYQLLLFGAIPFINPHLHPLAFVLYFAAISVVLVTIMRHKGEPSRWRWGKN